MKGEGDSYDEDENSGYEHSRSHVLFSHWF